MKKNEKGFTLVELVIVIAVIGILAAVLIPTVTSVIGKAEKTAAETQARNILTHIYAEDESFEVFCNSHYSEGKEADGYLAKYNVLVIGNVRVELSDVDENFKVFKNSIAYITKTGYLVIIAEVGYKVEKDNKLPTDVKIENGQIVTND